MAPGKGTVKSFSTQRDASLFLRTVGIGDCVGVAFYDKETKQYI